MNIKRFVLIAASLFFLGIVGIFSIDFWMSLSARDRIYYQLDAIPSKKIGLVLGTSKYIGKTLNPYYSYRMEAAKQLYLHNKIEILLLSGDNAHRSYNEPWTMKRDMLNAGVPEERIFLDYAGFRTLDSVVRAKEVFDADEFILITQAFHCERALFIADNTSIDASCFAVPSPKGIAGYKIRFREVFARVKAFLDIYVLNKQPKFLGPKESISIIGEP